MLKFRKKSVVIEAMQFLGLDSYLDIIEWMRASGDTRALANEIQYRTPIMLIPTLEGTMSASPGDYIIRGVKGEFYPCKPDIFEATYADVDAVEPPGCPTPGACSCGGGVVGTVVDVAWVTGRQWSVERDVIVRITETQEIPAVGERVEVRVLAAEGER